MLAARRAAFLAALELDARAVAVPLGLAGRRGSSPAPAGRWPASASATGSVGALVLSEAPGGGEGAVSAALQLIEAIGIALFAGLGGVLVALGPEHGWGVRGALATIVAAAGAAAALGLVGARRVAA